MSEIHGLTDMRLLATIVEKGKTLKPI